MIGNDRNRVILRWNAARIVRHAWSRLYCYLYGHHYHPLYIQWGGKVQYECQCCGELTPWMHKREHHAFLLKFCPTWGDRGSDSQGYKKMGKLHKPPVNRTIGIPEGGWKSGVYLVRLAISAKSPIINGILHVPILSSSRTPTEECIWTPHMERQYKLKELHYLEIVMRSDELGVFL